MVEINIDCLVGPTHHFGGLAYGNIASQRSQATLSHPKKAALQGLEKMKLLIDLGCIQLVLPPHPKPDYTALHALGFTGSEQELLEKVFKEAPELLLMCSSSSAMWTANAATVTPSCDSNDKKLHLTPANLAANFHRSLEVPWTTKIFRKAFATSNLFSIHDALPAASELFDEGAANHTRFSTPDNAKGLHFFVYGKSLQAKRKPYKYPPRQSLEAQVAISRRHKIPENQLHFAEQNPHAIDLGVFHNDVISTGHNLFYFFHEESFVNTNKVIQELQKKSEALFGTKLELLKVTSKELSLQHAVKNYIFNSQIVTSNGMRVLIAPHEAKATAKKFSDYFDKVCFVELNESMKNGGGPACLRLRVDVSRNELPHILQSIFLTPTLYQKLKQFIQHEYPDSFHLKDLLDVEFRSQVTKIQNGLMQILGL